MTIIDIRYITTAHRCSYIVIYEAISLDMAQGRMYGASNENQIHFLLV